MRKKLKLVYGMGTNDFSSNIYESGKVIPEYRNWSRMLERCYSSSYLKKNPTYQDCEVEPFLLSFTNFYHFIRRLNGFGEVDENGKPFQLDKDLLVKGNKTYSVDTICFVPQEINSFLTSKVQARGIHPIGVSFNKIYLKYQSQISENGKLRVIGYYNTPEEAFYAYKTAKEDQAKHLARKWFGKIDERVYLALYNYEVNIDD